MSWFGGGGNKDEPAEKSFDMDSGGHMADAVPLGGGGGGGLADLQQFGVQLQQQMLIQGVITDMADRAFIRCVTGTIKDGHLTGKEVACIQASTNKWLDANDLLVGRLARKGQQQQQAAQGFH